MLDGRFITINIASRKYFSLVLTTACLSMLSCASRDQPAPVSELYNGKTYRDFEQHAYSGKTYQVRAGDTLFSIAWYSGNDYKDLAKINNISAPYSIYPGQLISLATPVKSIQLKSNKSTGTTRKTIINQGVDPSKKQAYGESQVNVNKASTQTRKGKFPNRIKKWVWPTLATVSRGFSAKEAGNKGLDFLGRLGVPILAAADGKVVYTGSALRGFGQLVIIKHSEAYLTAYAHNDQILVKEQQWVQAGQKIAEMGRSGTDRVKLHFEVRYKGKSIDPLRYLPKR